MNTLPHSILARLHTAATATAFAFALASPSFGKPGANTERAAAPRPATLLLITDKSLAQAWEPFADWKTRLGKSTKLITVDQIAAGHKGEAKPIQELIRLTVREHIENHGTRWVLLGGDCLPDGEGLVPGGHTTVHAMEPAGIPTDIVYLSPTDWDADDDGIHGEWRDDKSAITYPDGTVGLGRVPVRTAEDVAAFTEKVIAFESRYPGKKFAAQMIYTCTDSPAYPKVRRSWDDHVSKAWKNGSVERFFNTETPWDEEGKPGSHDLSAENLVALFNDRKAGKLHIHGHGHLPLWVLERSQFTAANVRQLNNDGAYPLITTVSCNTGEYDGRKDPSIVESMLRQPKAGSVAIVAPVRTGKAHFHKRSDFRLMVTEGKLDGTTMTMTRYWENGLGAGATTGEALMQAKAAMAEDATRTAGYHLCICELNLLGDPTLDMRASDPKPIQLDAPAQVSSNKQQVKIQTDAPRCTVCLWKGSELYLVADADAKGLAEFNLPQLTPGEILITASGQSLNAASAKITVATK